MHWIARMLVAASLAILASARPVLAEDRLSDEALLEAIRNPPKVRTGPAVAEGDGGGRR